MQNFCQLRPSHTHFSPCVSCAKLTCIYLKFTVFFSVCFYFFCNWPLRLLWFDLKTMYLKMQIGVRLWIFTENDIFKGRPWLLLLPSCFVVMHISNKSKIQHYSHHQQRQTTLKFYYMHRQKRRGKIYVRKLHRSH